MKSETFSFVISHLFLFKLKDIAETSDGKYGTDIVVDALDVNMSALSLSVLQNSEKEA